MIGQYGMSESFKNAFSLLCTRVLYPGARLLRRPIYVRGGRGGVVYGPGLTTGYSCRFDLGGEGVTLRIGANCKMNDRVHISAYESVSIGDNVLMASNIFISDNSHGSYGEGGDPPDTPPDGRPIVTRPVAIGDNVWIGEGACVLAGVEVGSGCVIGSNAVVTRSVPANSVVAGCPARVIKRWDEGARAWVPAASGGSATA